ncbi:CLUMA_CG009416, isoform A [Clunio marinus]|uniref:CLUMA_CG009416, isoform A n=1 Tax=Clunio marinus TaxID=568069 RepID=A0A1J1I6P0_9DIPT|nr:CLUMA_CG009416, isoform A [Clunio marinus]
MTSSVMCATLNNTCYILGNIWGCSAFGQTCPNHIHVFDGFVQLCLTYHHHQIDDEKLRSEMTIMNQDYHEKKQNLSVINVCIGRNV